MSTYVSRSIASSHTQWLSFAFGLLAPGLVLAQNTPVNIPLFRKFHKYKPVQCTGLPFMYAPCLSYQGRVQNVKENYPLNLWKKFNRKFQGEIDTEIGITSLNEPYWNYGLTHIFHAWANNPGSLPIAVGCGGTQQPNPKPPILYPIWSVVV
jgi:hypothetical protein